MRFNADENITNWNDSLREIIRRLDWDYFELNDKSKKILEKKDDYTLDPIGHSLSQLRIFSFELRDSVSKDIRIDILRILGKYEKYIGHNMKVIDENIMTFYIIDFAGAINDIRTYLDNN